MWAIRCVHEASLYDRNCVVTLTYDAVHVPSNGSLVYSDVQQFLKRLRQHRRRFFLREHFHFKQFSQLSKAQMRQLQDLARVRFFCGCEYGEEGLRPHYHIVLFNVDFADKRVAGSRDGVPCHWTSVECEKLWKKGGCLIGVMDFDSAAYVARYIVPKVFGDLAKDHYRIGEPEELLPEFARMSRRDGIGMPWMKKFWQETKRDLSVWHKAKRVHMPRVYQEYLESIVDCEDAKAELDKRMKVLDSSPARLVAGAKIASARLGLSRRKL